MRSYVHHSGHLSRDSFQIIPVNKSDPLNPSER